MHRGQFWWGFHPPDVFLSTIHCVELSDLASSIALKFDTQTLSRLSFNIRELKPWRQMEFRPCMPAVAETVLPRERRLRLSVETLLVSTIKYFGDALVGWILLPLQDACSLENSDQHTFS